MGEKPVDTLTPKDILRAIATGTRHDATAFSAVLEVMSRPEATPLQQAA